MFKDRKEAGERLGRALENYRHCDGIVLAVPRGGIEVGHYVARHLDLPMSVIIVRKLPFPDNPEAGFGAVAEDDSTYFHEKIYDWVPFHKIQSVIDKQKAEVRRRAKIFRNGSPLPPIAGRTVIVVDDGIAMGSTMQAAVMLCRNKEAKKIVVAAPVAAMSTAMEMAKIADDVVIVEKPSEFRAVADFYENWHDVLDEDVIEIMQKSVLEGKKNA